ncbi:MAG: DnaB-like helicase C-terminal domain-containing protein [Xanthobacteraceae bacterium]|nr:DnaB-like helicase C-terminal domain-containing protein [Xanthobacteraceae bacterium]
MTKPSQLSTGLKTLDNATGGLAPADLILVAGWTATGKTALVTTMAANVARAGFGVAFYSLEMSRQDIARRLLAADTNIPARAQQAGKVGGDDGLQRLAEAAAGYDGVPLHVSGGPFSAAELVEHARTRIQEHAARLVVVDNLQLMGGDVDDAAQRLKGLAAETGLPIVAVSRMGVDEEGEPLPPIAASVGGSTAADVVLILNREHGDAPDIEVTIAKHRHRPTCTVELGFDGPRTLFMDRGQS